MFKLIVSLLFFISTSYGITIGNPADPALIDTGLIFEEAPFMSFRTSYLSNYIIKAKYRNLNGTEVNTSYTNYIGKGILNIMKRLDVYAFVGAARGDSTAVSNTQKITIEQKQMITAGGGAKAIIFEDKERYFWGVDAKYYRYYPSVDHVIVNGADVNIDELELKTWQWEFSSAVARRYQLFTPYAGISYLIARQKPKDANQYITNSKQINPWGLFLGTTMTYRDAFSLNAEAKFFNQIEYGISADFRF